MTVYGLQYDTTGQLPFTPALAAYYINGRYARQPVTYGPGRVWMDVLGTAPWAAFWLDVESGDATPADVPVWLDLRRQAGLGWGGIYCNRAGLAAVLTAAGDRPFSLWLATLDGTIQQPALPAGVTLVAVQVYPAAMTGLDADISVVVDEAYWAARHGS